MPGSQEEGAKGQRASGTVRQEGRRARALLGRGPRSGPERSGHSWPQSSKVEAAVLGQGSEGILWSQSHLLSEPWFYMYSLNNYYFQVLD